ncbi:DUF2750 domain-containing protein [Planctomycetota bacterium]
MAGFRNTATCQENHERFVRRVVDDQTVWGLKGEGGWACCDSNDYEDVSVLLFWSDRAYAERARKAKFSEYEAGAISLFDFLFRWLPGMAGDDSLAGTNWTGDLVGLEYEPADLQQELKEALPETLLAEYTVRFSAETG